jgi:hypothetical protein
MKRFFTKMFKHIALSTIAVAMVMSAAPVRASTLTADGVTYSLTEQVVSSTTNQFTLTITGINGPSDTEKGRFGVQSFAFTLPSNFSSAAAPSGFTFQGGGLSAGGCNGNGGFFCFVANTTPSGLLAANSTLTYTFDVTLSSGSFSGYDPGFKINWDGTNNNYDLVSKELAPSVTPLPASWTMMLSGIIIALGFMLYQRRKRDNGMGAPAAS